MGKRATHVFAGSGGAASTRKSSSAREIASPGWKMVQTAGALPPGNQGAPFYQRQAPELRSNTPGLFLPCQAHKNGRRLHLPAKIWQADEQ